MSQKAQKDQVIFPLSNFFAVHCSTLLSCCTCILWVLQLKDLSHKLIRDRTDKYKRSKQQSPNPAAAALSSSTGAAGATGQQIMSPKLLALINNLPVCPHSLLKYLTYTT